MTFDFDGIKTELKNRLSLLSNFATTLYFGVYERILDVIAYIIQKLIYIAEFFYREASWQHAQQRDSLVAMSPMLSYRPHRNIGATGSLQLSADITFEPTYVYTGPTITIPRWTRFTDEGATIKLYATEANAYNTNHVGNLLIDVRQGEVKQYVYIAFGASNEIVTLYGNNIDNDEFEIWLVNTLNEKIEKVYICSIDSTEEELFFINDMVNLWCKIENSNDFETVVITFGDGINQRMLKNNNRVMVIYATTDGADGNVTALNTVNTIVDTLYTSLGDEATVYVNNDTAISNGVNIEDIEHIRLTGRRLFYAGYRCGADTDWLAILGNVPFIYKATAWTIEDLGGSTVVSEQNTVYIAGIGNDGEDLTIAQKALITTDYLNPYKSLTEFVHWEIAVKVYLRADIIGTIKNKPIPIVEGLIKDVITAKYDVLNTDFAISIYESNMNTLIESNIPEVKFHSSELYYMERNANIFYSNHEIIVSYKAVQTPILEKQVYLVTDTPEIWIKRKIADVWGQPFKIGYTIGTAIVHVPGCGFTITSGAVDYANNLISYIIDQLVADVTHVVYGVQNPSESDPLGFILSLTYKCKDGNGEYTNSVRLPYFYQITDIDSDYIFCDLVY